MMYLQLIYILLQLQSIYTSAQEDYQNIPDSNNNNSELAEQLCILLLIKPHLQLNHFP